MKIDLLNFLNPLNVKKWGGGVSDRSSETMESPDFQVKDKNPALRHFLFYIYNKPNILASRKVIKPHELNKRQNLLCS